MCGINGIVTKMPSQINVNKALNEMNNQIIHRGPDDDGFFTEQAGDLSIGFAMRRLSIIDLSTGKQPIFSNDKKKVIVFNGEIYNFKDLRNQLINKGYRFQTNSDTEVIVNLYDCFDTASFDMLDGMFSFCIYDKIKGKIFIARDFFGEKPLYYLPAGNYILWGSELKSILKIIDFKPEINQAALNLYFQLTYIPAPFSIFKGIKKLEANHYLEIDLKDLSISVYPVKQTPEQYEPQSQSKAIKVVHDMVQKSVEERAVSDVPIGAFLSGGVDSSIVSLCLAQQSSTRINTFSIGFEEKSFDETDKSKLVSQLIKSHHHEFILSPHDLEANVSEILLNFDEPFADSSSLASFIVAQKTRQYAHVALTGDGGDEVFGGYNKYYIGKLNRKYTSIIPKFIHSSICNLSNSLLKDTTDKRGLKFKLNKLVHAINYDGDFYYKIISLGYQEDELSEILFPEYHQNNVLGYFKEKMGKTDNTLTDFREIDRLISLEGDMLVKVDRTSMLSSLECRAPFLNKQIWNYTRQLPENYLMRGWNKKYILKEAFKQYFPNGFLDRSKKGFGVPVGNWLRTILKSELEKYAEKDFVERQGIFHYEKVMRLIKAHLEGKVDQTFKVWTFYCFQKWYVSYYGFSI